MAGRAFKLSVRFALLWFWTAAGSASATPLWGRARRAESGVALRWPPQSKEVVGVVWPALSRRFNDNLGMHRKVCVVVYMAVPF